MAGFDAGNRVFARTHAVKKISHVVVAHLQLDGVVRQRFGQKFFIVKSEEKFGVDNLSEPVTIADRTASRIIVEGLAEGFDLFELRPSSYFDIAVAADVFRATEGDVHRCARRDLGVERLEARVLIHFEDGEEVF